MSISHHGPLACCNMLKLPGQGEGKKCGCWAYMARDWCFSQRTGKGGLMLVFSWRHVWNLTFLWHMFWRMHHHAVCVGPPSHRGNHHFLKPHQCFLLCVKGDHFAMTGSPDEGYYVGNIAGVPRPLDDGSFKTWEVENGPPPNKVDPLKKSFSGPISNLRTGSVFFGYIDLCQPFPSLKAKYPALEDARRSTRISGYSAQYWWHHYSLPMLEAQKVGRFFGFFPFVWRAFLRRQACWV